MSVVFSGYLNVRTNGLITYIAPQKQQQQQGNRPMRDNKRNRYNSENGVILQSKGTVSQLSSSFS